MKRPLFGWALLPLLLLGAPSETLGRACEDCHDAPHFGATGFLASAHKTLKCTDCHSDLVGSPHSGLAEAGASRATAREACRQCHAKEVVQYETSAHAAAVRGGSHQAATCFGCHGEPHALAPAFDRIEALNPARHPQLELCARCHADPDVIREAGLKAAVLETYEHSVHGARGRLGLPGIPRCTDCHGTHAIQSPADPTAPLHADNRAELCGRCHEGAGASFAHSFEHTPHTREAFPLAYWVKKFFSWLLVITCVCLAAHVFLDLQSHLRERLLNAGGRS